MLPPRIDAMPEEIARRVLSVPRTPVEYREYRCKACGEVVESPDVLFGNGRCEKCVRPTSYYLRPSHLGHYTQLVTWNDVDESEVTFYEVGVSMDESELQGWSVNKPDKPILIAFPKSYFTCTGHRSLVVHANVDQPWLVKVRLRSLNAYKHQSDFAECHLGTMYEADYDGRFLNNEHTDRIPNFPSFSIKGEDDEEWSPNLFSYLHNEHWNQFASIENMLDGYGRRHYQITRMVDGKIVKPYDKTVSTERHLPYTAQRIKEKVSGLPYTDSYDCCRKNYRLYGQPDIFIHFEFFGSRRVAMQAKTRQQLKRVEMSTGAEFGPRFENGYWIW